ncbi:endonuclease-reverse transcriptase [Apostichopus japonicus]|uniref:Endonuclease-reverse transcriptase n=1 Tax=Stichopus japonicus TaxID=307972 RepID=A0A2G8LQ85_STIJA|nr:endonuclease-reverse transcriptase [Apostichopus japonicus]
MNWVRETDERIEAEVEIDLGVITRLEVHDALIKTSNGKSLGLDQVTAELLKADVNATVERLTDLFNIIWSEESTPKRWNKGLIVKIPKKGDLTDCSNWRGVTLLPVMSKIFGRVLINRLKDGVDKVLRQEQAGFRPNRSTTEQIFTLRNILEQSNEWNSPLYVHFIDFEKAFDSLHRNSLWNILKEYQIPDKIIRIVKALYDNVECAVVDEGETTEWFHVTSGVKQGCVMSGFLFLLAIDWMMKRVLAGERRGIRWRFTTQLEDLDFADDIALLSAKHDHIQKKTEKVEEMAGRIGLNMNVKKCKHMRMNNRVDAPLKINNIEVEDVEEFISGAKVSKDGGGTEDIKNRLGKARGAFRNLRRIWTNGAIGRKTKLTLFKTLVRSVLLYGSEAWKVTKREEQKLDAFQFKCIRRILKIPWTELVSNDRISSKQA